MVLTTFAGSRDGLDVAKPTRTKRPTMLLYPEGHDRPSAWGFRAEVQSQQNQDHGVVREWFKTLLDPENLIRERDRFPSDDMSYEDVRHWFRDYLSLLYEHLKLKLATELPNFEWSLAKIEFLFSVPTTWDHGTVEQFKLIVGQAGFGGPANANHSVTLSLTEPEAAAVHTSTAAAGIFKEDDILVVLRCWRRYHRPFSIEGHRHSGRRLVAEAAAGA